LDKFWTVQKAKDLGPPASFKLLPASILDTPRSSKASEATGQERKRKYINDMKNPLLSLLAPVALVTITGCQVLTYRAPTGERFTRSTLGSTTSIASLTVEGDTNGVRHVELKGYQNDSTQALGVVTDAAIKAAVQSIK
jgi:hypothetical protein